jgi:hypothetical protein
MSNHKMVVDSPGPRRSTRRGVTPIQLGPARAVPISEEDYQQAVAALAAMIVTWWRGQEGRPPE